MSSGLEQLTQMIGANGVRYQILSTCVVAAKALQRPRITHITFGTKCADVADAVSAEKMVGVVLWIPRRAYDDVVKGGAK